MYIQTPDSARKPFFLPDDYSGNAFRQEETEKTDRLPLPPLGNTTGERNETAGNGRQNGRPDRGASDRGTSDREAPDYEMTRDGTYDGGSPEDGGGNGETDRSGETNNANGGCEKNGVCPAPENRKWQGLFSRFPFLSSLFPQKRGDCRAVHETDWILPVLILLIMGQDQAGEVLPYLLILWLFY